MKNTQPTACDNCEIVTRQLSPSLDNAAIGWMVCPNCLALETDEA